MTLPTWETITETDFERRLKRIKATKTQTEDKPDFTASPMHSAPPRKQISQDVGAALANHILGFGGPLWSRILLRGGLTLAEGTFDDASTPSEYVETGTTFAQRAFRPEVIKAQFELDLIGLRVSTGTMSEEDMRRYTADNDAELRRLEKLASLED